MHDPCVDYVAIVVVGFCSDKVPQYISADVCDWWLMLLCVSGCRDARAGFNLG